MRLSEAANRVIDLARQVHDYYAAELPKRHPNYPVIGLGEEMTPPPLEEKQLREFLATLSDGTVYQLLLLMYLGRGDFGADDLAENYETLRGTFGDPSHAVSQMMDKASLADYLSDGLEELGKRGINVDRMPLKRIKTRKR